MDGRRVNIPSYIVKPEQTISLKPQLAKTPIVQGQLASTLTPPDWLEAQDTQGRVLRAPIRDEIDGDIAEHLIVEFYSR